MRGKAVLPDAVIPAIGITPAYAGKSGNFRRLQGSDKDHPRLCGEKRMIDLSVSCVRGSPPPMRGKGFLPPEHRSSCRITPAYAGKSILLCRSYAIHKDHPRLCGEKFQHLLGTIFQQGSPPPMRGKAFVLIVQNVVHRITPAYAGKRPPTAATKPEPRDHPRLCGEKPTIAPVLSGTKGSPPPMRGKVPYGI